MVLCWVVFGFAAVSAASACTHAAEMWHIAYSLGLDGSSCHKL